MWFKWTRRKHHHTIFGGIEVEHCKYHSTASYWTLQDVINLSLKVEKQLANQKKWVNRLTNDETTNDRTRFSKGKPSNQNPHVARKCFWCQGFEHIGLNYPNNQIMTLMEEYEDEDRTNTKWYRKFTTIGIHHVLRGGFVSPRVSTSSHQRKTNTST